MVSCSFQADTSVRSIHTRICRMTRAPSGAALVSRQRPHWSLIPRFSLQLYPNCSAVFLPLPCVTCYMSMDFCQDSPLALLARVRLAGRRTSRQAALMPRSEAPSCITRRQKLCCCLGIDINWPFQSLFPNSKLLSAPLLFSFIPERLETKAYSVCGVNPWGGWQTCWKS